MYVICLDDQYFKKQCMTELTSVTLKNQSTNKGQTLIRQVLALRYVQQGTEWLFLCVCMKSCNNTNYTLIIISIVYNSAEDLEVKIFWELLWFLIV